MNKTAINIILTAFILSLSLLSVKAQSEFEPRFLVGAKGGMNYYMINTDVRFDTGLVAYNSTYGGLKASLQVEKYAALLIEFNYLKKGGLNLFSSLYTGDSVQNSDINPYYTVNLTYFEIPLLTQLSFGKHNSKLRVTMGPHVALLQSQDSKIVGTETQFAISVRPKLEFGINAGLAYAYCYPKGEIAFEVRYSHGLSNLYESQSISQATVYQNQTVSATLSYAFNLLKASKPEKKEKEPEIKEKN